MPTTRLIELVKHHEGWRSQAYLDPVGIWTIGWGRTEGVYSGELTTPEHEKRWLDDALGYYSDSIMELVSDSIALSQNQLDALTSFCFNLGMSNFKNSTLLVRINQGHFDDAAAEFPRWIKAGKPLRVLPGLVRRREDERQLFLG
jgi:GH24 family phage-related lysozyme (muramidase)